MVAETIVAGDPHPQRRGQGPLKADQRLRNPLVRGRRPRSQEPITLEGRAASWRQVAGANQKIFPCLGAPDASIGKLH